MKPTALSLFAILLAGCAQVVEPPPPGMPMDQEFVPESNERAITRNFPSS